VTACEDPREELADIVSRLRRAIELKSIIEEGKFPPAIALRPGPGRPASPLERPSVASGKAQGIERPARAARVTTPIATESVLPFDAQEDTRLAPSWQKDPAGSSTLGELHDNYSKCQRCPLGDTRTNFVFGVGNANAHVMFIGEAPGRDEDLQGEPFVGRAGQLLNKILEAVGFKREEVYIANILKCRPPGNRDPLPTEIASCEPILARQIQLIRPMILCALGSFAARTLLGVNYGISKIRGTVHSYRGVPLIATYHPAALLRNPSWKRPTWDDVQLLRREYDRLAAESGRSTK
jgi:DNA polymerase